MAKRKRSAPEKDQGFTIEDQKATLALLNTVLPIIAGHQVQHIAAMLSNLTALFIVDNHESKEAALKSSKKMIEDITASIEENYERIKDNPGEPTTRLQ